MTQTVVLQKFCKYLDVTSKKYVEELENQKSTAKDTAELTEIDNLILRHKAYILQFKESLMRGGYCHGFSVCHGAMDCIGELEWWEKVLSAIANWDETEATLDKNLDSLFYRALNYIIFHQADSRHPGFDLRDMDQRNFLEPDLDDEKRKFVALTKDKSLTIKNVANIAGYFTDHDLMVLLNENLIKDNIFTIDSCDHSIRIGFDGQTWTLYDPNYKHQEITKIHFSGTKNEVINEIFNRLNTHGFRLRVASFNPQPLAFPVPDKGFQIFQSENIDHTLLNQIIKDLSTIHEAKWTGLLFLAGYAPDTCKRLFQMAAKNSKLLNVIAILLVKENKDAWTVIHLSARQSPQVLAQLFELAITSQNPKLVDAIASSLEMKNKDGNTPIDFIKQYAPATLKQLFQLANTIQNPLLDRIIIKFCEGESDLEFLRKNAPQALNELFHVVNKNKKDQIPHAVIADWLSKIDKNNSSTLNLLFITCPDATKEFFLCAETNQTWCKAITQIVPQEDNSNWTLLHMFARYTPQALAQLFELAIKSRNIELVDAIALSLNKKNKDGLTAFELMRQYAPAALKQLFQLANTTHNQNLLAAITQFCQDKGANDETGLQFLITKAPNEVIQLFQLADKTNEPNLLKVMKDLLSIKSKNEWTNMHRLARYAPNAAKALFQIASTNQTFFDVIISMLPEKNNEMWTVSHLLARYAEDAVNELFLFAEKKPMLREVIANVLPQEDNFNWTLLHICARYTPQALAQLFELAIKSRNIELVDAIALSLNKKNKDGLTAFELMRQYAPAALKQLFQLANTTQNQHLLAAITQFCQDKDVNNESGLQFLITKEPDEFQLACKGQHDKLHSAMSHALKEKINNTKNCFHLLFLYAPNALDQLFQLAAKHPALHQVIFNALPEKLKVEPLLAENIIPTLINELFSHTNNTNETLQKIIIILSTPYNNRTMWQMITLKKNSHLILEETKNSMKKLTDEELIALGKKLRAALYDPNSEYRGLCSERHSQSIFRNDYGKTNIWQELMSHNQDLLKSRIKKPAPDVQELLDQHTSRFYS